MSSSSLTVLGSILSLAITANAAPFVIPQNDLRGRLEVQAHRGGLGMRSEESLWAFAYAMEVGVDTLEMDLVFTSDGVPVIWHDHYIQAEKCNGSYVGQYIANLTLAQVKTLDCANQLAAHPQAELHPPTRIATLEEVLDLVDCYGEKGVTINLETKLDPLARNETLDVSVYIEDIVPILEKRGYADRTYIQSFDWRTLVGIHAKWPKIPIVALLDPTTVVPEKDGSYPWLGGVDLGAFGGDWVAAAASIGSTVLSPWHGQGKSTNDPAYIPFTTKDVVNRAHAAGMQVIPWTVDTEVTINKLIDDGVDAIISNYPERVLWIGKQRGLSVGRARSKSKPECLANANK